MVTNAQGRAKVDPVEYRQGLMQQEVGSLVGQLMTERTNAKQREEGMLDEILHLQETVERLQVALTTAEERVHGLEAEKEAASAQDEANEDSSVDSVASPPVDS